MRGCVSYRPLEDSVRSLLCSVKKECVLTSLLNPFPWTRNDVVPNRRDALALADNSIDLVVATPLCENLPGPSANKPGDV